MNNISGSNGSSEFRNVPYNRVFNENISSVDFVLDRKNLKSNIYSNHLLLKIKVKLSVIK